jgi:ArsR family transcriptional regulator
MEREILARTLKVLGDPTRMGIFDMLMEGVQCNCEIADRLGLSLSLVSHHLHALRQVGLVQGERADDDARWIYYSIDQQAVAELNRAVHLLLDIDRIQPRLPSCGPQAGSHH